MPKPALSYAEHILPLLNKGLSQRQIAEQLSVTKSAVNQSIRRARLRSVAKAFAATVVEANPTDRARCFVSLMATDCEDSFARIRSRNPPRHNMAELERENVLEKLNKRARLTYGLDAVGNKSVVVGISVKLGTNLTPQDIDVQACGLFWATGP